MRNTTVYTQAETIHCRKQEEAKTKNQTILKERKIQIVTPVKRKKQPRKHIRKAIHTILAKQNRPGSPNSEKKNQIMEIRNV
jgi:hypothetical protein